MSHDSQDDGRIFFKPLPQKRAFEEIADQIRELIYTKALNPGDKLPSERELSIQFRAGRISVREALRMLEQAGLVYIRQGSEGGAFVKDVDVSALSGSIFEMMRRADVKLQDLTELRIAIEALVIDLAFRRMTESDLVLLEKNVEEAEAKLAEVTENGATFDFDLIAEINVDFHLILARATQNQLVELFAESLMRSVHFFFGQSVPLYGHLVEHVKRHRAVFEAIKARNRSAAKRELKEHAIATKQHFEELTTSNTAGNGAG